MYGQSSRIANDMVYIATAAQLLYEEISTCQGTKKAPKCQAEANYFSIDSNR